MSTDSEPLFAPFLDDGVHMVFFDFDGTLVFHRPDSFDVIGAFCSEIGQPLSTEAERRGRRTRHEYFIDPVIRDQVDGLPRDQFWHHFNRHILEALDIEGDLERFAAEITALIASIELVYYCPEAGCQTLTELRARGYDLGLVTNRENLDHFHDLLDQTELWPYFDLILAAGEVGVRKPEPGIFHAALERSGSSAEESLYVGDNYWADVVGARRAGVTPVLFDPHRLFPEADCLVLERIQDLLAWLPGREAV